MITINHERFGMRQEFDTLAEAQQSIRDCGPEFSGATLEMRSDQCVYDERGERVGAETPDETGADWICGPSDDD